MNESIKVINKQGVELDGHFYNANSKICILHIPGFGGTFEGLPQKIGEYIQNNKMTYLCGLNQGSYPEYKFKQYNKNGSITLKQGGGIYEDFDDCILDIQAWLDFISANDFDKIYLLGHSMGCNKILHYLSIHKCKNLCGLIFLAPQDFTNIVDNPIHKGMILEAEKNLNLGLNSKLLTNKFLGFSPISSFTFANFKNNPHIHNFQYKNFNSNFDVLQKINKPTFVIMGEKDQTFDDLQDKTLIPKYFENIAKKVNDFSFKIIPNARHTFKTTKTEVAKEIVDFITCSSKN